MESRWKVKHNELWVINEPVLYQISPMETNVVLDYNILGQVRLLPLAMGSENFVSCVKKVMMCCRDQRWHDDEHHCGL